MRRASFDLPAPVGPVSRSGAAETPATCSIRAIRSLKSGLRVSMPALRNDRSSRCRCWNRAASRSYFERSRSMMVYDPGSPERCRFGGAVCSSRAGKYAGLGQQEQADLRDVRAGRDVDQIVFAIRIERIAAREVVQRAVDQPEVPGVAEVQHVRTHLRFRRLRPDVVRHDGPRAPARDCRAATRAGGRRGRRAGRDPPSAARRSSGRARARDRASIPGCPMTTVFFITEYMHLYHKI